MNLAIVWTAFNRPLYLRHSLASWRRVRGIESASLYLSLEPSVASRLVRREAARSGLSIQIVTHEARQGMGHHQWVAMELAFQAGHDFVVLAEDDCAVSTDVLEYFAWAASLTIRPMAVCSFSRRAIAPDAAAVELLPDFCPIVWGTWAAMWRDRLRDNWDHAYASHPDMTQAGWDRHLWRLARQGSSCLFPRASRSQHLGRIGVHIGPDTFTETVAPTFVTERSPAQYELLAPGAVEARPA